MTSSSPTTTASSSIPAAEAAASLLGGRAVETDEAQRRAAILAGGASMIAVWALVAFVAVIIVWNAVFKRNIGEAMIVGFLAVGVFALVGGGSPAWTPSARRSSTRCRRRSPSPGWPSCS